MPSSFARTQHPGAVPTRLEAACDRALHIGGVSYRSVKSILKNGLDQIPLEEQMRISDMGSLDFEERFALLLEQEVTARDDRCLTRLLRTAKLSLQAAVGWIAPSCCAWPAASGSMNTTMS